MFSQILRRFWLWARAKASVWVGLGVAGFLVSCVPIEIFPGVHLVFGSTLSVLTALKFGPLGGGVAGLIAGLPTAWLWNQSFPFSAGLYALEGVWVGYAARRKGRSALGGTLSYWVILGSWLNLLGQLLIFGIPATLAFIIQARSIVNGLLTGLIVEIGIWSYELYRRWSGKAKDEPARLNLESLVTILLASVISFPMLYISTRNARNVRERMKSDLFASSSTNVKAVENEIRGLLENYKRGIAIAVTTISPAHRDNDKPLLAQLLKDVIAQYPEFSGMYVADAHARTIAFDPEIGEGGQSTVGLDFSDRQYYRDLRVTKKTVFSDVYQARGGMTGPVVAIGEPILDSRDNFTGFVLGWFDVRVFRDIVGRYAQDGETLMVADSKGLLLADSSQEHGAYKEAVSLERFPAGNVPGSTDSVAIRDFELIRGTIVGTFDHVEAERHTTAVAALGDTVHFTVSTMPITEWKVWSRQSLRPLKNRLDKLYLDQIIVLALTLLLGVGLGRIVGRLLTKPITALQFSAEKLSAGNLSERPHSRAPITAELDSLYRSFLLMAENIESGWRRKEELLREVSIAKGEWEATFDAMADAVVIADLDDHLVRANRAFYQLLNLDPVASTGKRLTEVMHPRGDWRNCDICSVRLKGRHAYLLSDPDDNQRHRYLGIRVDPIYNSEGERTGMVQVLRDLTDVRRAEVEAETAGALLRNLVEGAYDAMFATDLEGRFLWGNRRAAELFGFADNSVSGKPFLSSIHPDDFRRVKAEFSTVLRGEARKYEARYLTSDNVRPVLITNSPVYADGHVSTVFGIARDLTEDRLAAEQKRRNDKLRALGQLASGVAHNFNNSLTAVIGYTQMVLNKVSDPVIARQLKMVETAALDAAKMVQRIQNFAQQRQDEVMAAADLNQILRDALDLTSSRWRDDARASGLDYDVVFRPSDSVILTCDQSALREVFVNLIINALDAMPTGGRLTIITTVEEDAAILTFADSGCGMTDEVRQRIFEPFFTTKGTRGYGMGLAVSYGIIDRHGGQIEVTSEEGNGSTFVLRLPIGHEVTETAAVTPQLVPLRAGRASVLVVDDEAPIRALLADLLRARGHRVLMAEDGLAGLRAIEGARFDMVITDISMPGLDGWAVVSEVRRRWPETKLVVVTGYGGLIDQIILGRETDLVDALISKPFNLAEIDTTINELLREAQSSRPN